MVVRRAGFLDVRFDEVRVGDDIAIPRRQSGQHLDALTVAPPQLDRLGLVRLAHVQEHHVPVPKGLQGAQGYGYRHLRLADRDVRRDEEPRAPALVLVLERDAREPGGDRGVVNGREAGDLAC